MKTLAALGTAFLLLLLTASVPRLKAQEQENDRNSKSEQQQDDNKKPTAKPQQQENDKKQPTARPQEDRSHEQSKQEPKANRQDQERSDQDRARQGQAAPPEHQQQERTPVQAERNDRRPAEGQRGQRIPDDRFRASFGSRHTFHLRREEVINNPRPVIAYGGYSFELLEPWPAGWSFDDGCYIDYVDEQYYLLDPVHPEVRIALVVVNAD